MLYYIFYYTFMHYLDFLVRKKMPTVKTISFSFSLHFIIFYCYVQTEENKAVITLLRSRRKLLRNKKKTLNFINIFKS